MSLKLIEIRWTDIEKYEKKKNIKLFNVKNQKEIRKMILNRKNITKINVIEDWKSITDTQIFWLCI